MTTSAIRIKQIEALTPRQAFHTVQYMTAWLDEQMVEPQDLNPEQQIDILNTLFHEAGYLRVSLSSAAKPNLETAGHAARKLLRVLAETSGDDLLLAELDHWLAQPPKAETKAIVDLIVVPVVLTACITALQTNFEVVRGEDGKWRLKFTRRGSQGKDLKDQLQGIYGVTKSLLGVG
jgi:hypothetical protein